MPIHFACSCGNPVSAPDAAAGKIGKCPKCGAAVNVVAATRIEQAKSIGVHCFPLRRAECAGAL